MAHGGNTGSGGTGSLSTGQREGAVLGNARGAQNKHDGRQEKGKVQKGNRGLGLSAAARRALGNRIVVKVLLVRARVDVDGGGNGRGTGKGKDQVQKVNNGERNGEGEKFDKPGKHAVKDAKDEAKHGREEGKAHLGVAVVVTGNQRTRQAEHNDEKDKEETSKSRVGKGSHCLLLN